MTFGERLLIALRARKLTQSDLAMRMGCDKASITHYIYDLHQPNGYTLVKLAEALEVRPEWLMLGRTIAARPLEGENDEQK